MAEDNQILAETYSLNAFFRKQVEYPFAEECLNFLLRKGNITDEEIQKRWDNFDQVFGKLAKTISALSFSAITEAKDILVDRILEKHNKKDTMILELAAGFSPRGLNFINNKGYNPSYYIETDRPEVLTMKRKFYNSIKKSGKNVAKLRKLDVMDTKDWDKMLSYIEHIKQKNPNIKNIAMTSHGLIYYIDKNSQKRFFGNVKKFMAEVRKLGLKITYLKTDIPTHKNFTNWLVQEGFKHQDHLDVMNQVDSNIVESLHETEEDYLIANSIGKIKKYHYTNGIIKSLHTSNLEKYKDVDSLKKKIKKFLGQDILFIYEIS